MVDEFRWFEVTVAKNGRVLAEDMRAEDTGNVDALINYLKETRQVEILSEEDAGFERLVKLAIGEAMISIFFEDYPEGVCIVAENEAGDELVLQIARELDKLDLIKDE